MLVRETKTKRKRFFSWEFYPQPCVHSREIFQNEIDRSVWLRRAFLTIKSGCLCQLFQRHFLFEVARPPVWEDEALSSRKQGKGLQVVWLGRKTWLWRERKLRGKEKKAWRKPEKGNLVHKMNWKRSRQSAVGKCCWHPSLGMLGPFCGWRSEAVHLIKTS